ncbi:hypothetical protein RJ639_039640 [Escallonia herrerae]|uniref:GST C-terminal domain-containing protein n=1 Tax=Escallonia herrerae TaxID=1293975 RepID=A0AA89B870_9ASTE|nr:hypothetical protein RJ639_039640 [Escallonia herrerae]
MYVRGPYTDSSRYWIAYSYEERLENGLEPENADKDPVHGRISRNVSSAPVISTAIASAFVPAIISTFSKVGEEQDKVAKEARENLKPLESALEGKRFFGGETIGFGDIAIGWMGIWTQIVEEITDVKLIDEVTMPLLSAWFQDFLNAPIIKERLPPRDKLVEHNKGFHKWLTATST